MNVAVAGGGHVGLATAVGLARRGHVVDLIEVDSGRARLLAQARVPFREPAIAGALPALVPRRLRVHAEYPALHEVELGFICVDTLPGPDGLLDERRVLDAARALAASMPAGAPLVIRSTVQPGATRRIEDCLRREGATRAVLVNPEFLREGTALEDFEQPGRRRVIGGDDRAAIACLGALYDFDPLPPLLMDTTSAELAKLAANAALALRVSMANEIALSAIEAGARPEAVLAAVGSDPRIGADYLRPGLGFGGPCLPKDIAAMRGASALAGRGASVFQAALEINAAVIEYAAEQVERYLEDHGLRGVCIDGVAFKPDSDSTVHSPALALVQRLLARGIRVSICDPLAEAAARAALGETVEYLGSLDDVPPSDVVILAHSSARAAAAHGRHFLDALARPIETRRGSGK